MPQVPERFENMYSNIKTKDRRVYCGKFLFLPNYTAECGIGKIENYTNAAVAQWQWNIYMEEKKT